MIVVDTNIICYLYLLTKYTELAEQLLQKQPQWIAPVLWISEFRNVLTLYLRKNDTILMI
jgi:predicted nucleic acid-binding protein